LLAVADQYLAADYDTPADIDPQTGQHGHAPLADLHPGPADGDYLAADSAAATTSSEEMAVVIYVVVDQSSDDPYDLDGDGDGVGCE
jgi:hypothetical protein